MSRIKKSRNAGNSEPGFTGKRKETSSSAQEARERKRKAKLKGNKAGARNLFESQKTQQQNANKAKNDKRVGSKKAISLGSEQELKVAPIKKVPQPKVSPVKEQPQEEKSVKISAEKELMLIEDDQRLNELLEQLDNGEEVSQADTMWVDQQMQRHQALMKQLGWLDDDGEEDLIQQFESASSALDEFK